MKRQVATVLGIVLTAGVLAGCATSSGAAGLATPAGPVAAHPLPSATPEVTAVEDSAAVARAEAWLEGAVMPPGAVRSESRSASFISYYQWWCSPMVIRTGYWTVDGATVVEAWNWLASHPTADLITTTQIPIDEDPAITELNIGNVPFHGSLEGIAYTVSKTGDGVGIRAEIGVIPDNAVCPTPEPGTSFGGPGEG